MILVGYYLACIALFPAWLAIRIHRGQQLAPALSDIALWRLFVAVCAILGATNLLLVGAYVVFPGSIWGESESNVLANAAMAARGASYYSGPDGIGGHALLYGPLTFFPLQLVFELGGGLVAAKLLPLIAGAAGVALILREILVTAPTARARWTIGLAVAAFLLPHMTSLLVPKGDPWVLLYSALPLLTRQRRWHGLMIGVCGALAVATKIPAGLAFLPFLVDAIARQGWRPLAQAVPAGLVGLAATHLPLGAGLADYLALLQLASHHPITPQLAIATVLTLALPGALYFALLRHGLRLVDVALLLVTALLLVPAAKIGAGSYHLAVIFAPLTFRLCELWPTADPGPALKRVDAIFALLLSALIAAVHVENLNGFVQRAQRAENDLARIEPALRQLTPPFAIAPSHDGFGSLEPYQLVPSILAGAEAPVTVGALSDFHLAGRLIRPGTEEALLDCRWTWLSAADVAEPWGAMSTYWTLQNIKVRGEQVASGSLFGADFRSHFAARFTDRQTIGPFTAWRCPTQTAAMGSENR